MVLERPIGAQPHYGEHLGDPAYWSPYVMEVLHRHALPVAELEPPFVGSFPTFLVGGLVVKLFGPGFDGERSSRVEAAMHRLLAAHRSIPAPALVASGHLFDRTPTWPYLVTERVRGTAVRDLRFGAEWAERVAADLGEIVRALHTLTPPMEVEDRRLLAGLREGAPARLREFGLPEHLVEQVPGYLADAEPPGTLVHGDITADHVFADEEGLTAIIDWGDALVADRAYELPAVYLDALRGDRRLLDRFLDTAGWPRTQFARRGLQGILEFQFDAITAIARRVDLTAMPTLDDLASHLFGALPRPG